MTNSVIRNVVATLALVAATHAQSSESARIEIPGEMVVCFETESPQVDLQSTVSNWSLVPAGAGLRLGEARSLLQWQRRGEARYTNVVLVKYGAGVGGQDEVLRAQVQALPGVRWAAPNTSYDGDPRELTPNDPQYASQYHHTLMQNDAAWDIHLGDASVVIGITDDGVDFDHEDLAANIWTNPGEIAGDGIDNDANGYIDDVHGYDFVFGNNNPNPDSAGDDHGTHVAGIAGARTNNAIGLSGTAGQATIMPLQFYTSGQPWTAAIIAESFAYGVDNGAAILSTSYNLNTWVGDPVVIAAFDYLYDHDVLHFNSGGNGSEANPARQAFHQTILVVNTDSGDQKSSSSNWGTGMDVSAPGSSILSTILNDGYGLKSGTSMSAPNAAGVAALIWSANPTWTRDQVAAQLIGTADNIDAQNPTLLGLMGSGRVNSFKALTQTLPAPRVASATGLPADGSTLVGDLSNFSLRFDQVMSPATVNNPGAFSLVYAGLDGLFGTADDVSVGISWNEYLIAGNEVTFTVSGSFANAGEYRFSADAAILGNPFATPLDGDGNGVGGDTYTRTFSACATLVELEDNAESGVGWSVVNQSLTAGAWTAAPEVPNGGGVRNDPPSDFDGSGRCFLTENGPGNTDVDGGPTRLTSRAFDLSALADPYLSYARWFNASPEDTMLVDVSSDDGASWTPVESAPSSAEWQVFTFRVSDFVAPSAQTRLRFSVTDAGGATIVEAAVDRLRIVTTQCTPPIDVGSAYCLAATNSTGVGAQIRGTGSDVVASNNFTLITEQLPAGVTGLYYFGPNQVQAPFGEGFRCVGGATRRIFPLTTADPTGVSTRAVNLTSPATADILPGSSLNFQLWYRDAAGGPNGFNLSDGLNVLWQ